MPDSLWVKLRPHKSDSRRKVIIVTFGGGVVLLACFVLVRILMQNEQDLRQLLAIFGPAIVLLVAFQLFKGTLGGFSGPGSRSG